MFQDRLPDVLCTADARLEFGRLGSGRPLCYLHGCDGVSMADPFVGRLAEHFAVTVVSLPGFGGSERPKHVRTVRDIAHLLDKVLLTMDMKGCVLVGSSFGGWVATEMALLGSGLVSHMVLAAPMGARFTNRPEEAEIRDVFTTPTPDWPGIFIADPDLANAAFSGMRFADMPEDAALRFCRNREALTQFGWLPLLHDPGLAARLGEINIPTLVMAGDKDRVLATGYAEQFAVRIPGARFDIVENAGHYIPMEQAIAFTDMVKAFA